MTGPERPGPGRSESEIRLLRRASRTVALQFAMALSLVIMTIGAIALVLDEHQERAQAVRAGRNAVASEVDVVQPPTNVWFVVAGAGGGRTVSPGAPPGVGRLDPRALPDGPEQLTRDGIELVAWTRDRDVGRVSAVYDLRPREAEERPLIISLGIASLVGIAAATAIGWFLSRRAVRPLGTALALQRRFVADASHELRTPLAVLMLRAEMLERRFPRAAEPALEAELERLVRDTRAMSDVVNDLLLSMELAHRGRGGAQAVELWDLAADVVDSLQPLADQRAVTLTAARRDGPELDASATAVQGARPALRRAVMSLVDNAIAHTANGGHVQIEIGRQADQVVICVRDDGEGLDPKDAAHILERFARGTTDGRGRRFGLGLALVDEVARAHGGRLEVGGEPGRGAAFTVVLPSS